MIVPWQHTRYIFKEQVVHFTTFSEFDCLSEETCSFNSWSLQNFMAICFLHNMLVQLVFQANFISMLITSCWSEFLFINNFSIIAFYFSCLFQKLFFCDLNAQDYCHNGKVFEKVLCFNFKNLSNLLGMASLCNFMASTINYVALKICKVLFTKSKT